MLQKFTNHINLKFPFLKGKKLLVAISGGIDSVVLAHLLSNLDYSISLAHCNFTLRAKESDLDEEFIINLGKKLHLETYTKRFKTEEFAKKNKQSTQIAARNLRYAWFQEITEKHKFDYVLTAHHADDNLETFFINLSRGTGLEGLTGIPEINGNILRPLLAFSRAEIINFAKENNIDWREDKSNSSTKYIRNKIRHQVIPVLKEINPSLLESFSKTSGYLQESQEIIENSIKTISKEIIANDASNTVEIKKFDIEKMNQLSNPRAYLYQLLRGYNFTEWNDVYDLLFAQSGKQLFSNTHRLLRDRDYLILSQISEVTEKKEILIEINQTEIITPIHLSMKLVSEKSTCNKNTIYVDIDATSFPLKLRKWKNGDVFFPSGMEGKKKKLSKYFKDEKFSLLQKENTWLLCNFNDSIIWVIGHRQDHRFKSSKKTKQPLKIEFDPSL